MNGRGPMNKLVLTCHGGRQWQGMPGAGERPGGTVPGMNGERKPGLAAPLAGPFGGRWDTNDRRST